VIRVLPIGMGCASAATTLASRLYGMPGRRWELPFWANLAGGPKAECNREVLPTRTCLPLQICGGTLALLREDCTYLWYLGRTVVSSVCFRPLTPAGFSATIRSCNVPGGPRRKVSSRRLVPMENDIVRRVL
jgi:hypothetical protein